jgi:hypothetical protein
MPMMNVAITRANPTSQVIHSPVAPSPHLMLPRCAASNQILSASARVLRGLSQRAGGAAEYLKQRKIFNNILYLLKVAV